MIDGRSVIDDKRTAKPGGDVASRRIGAVADDGSFVADAIPEFAAATVPGAVVEAKACPNSDGCCAGIEIFPNGAGGDERDRIQRRTECDKIGAACIGPDGHWIFKPGIVEAEPIEDADHRLPSGRQATEAIRAVTV